MARTLIEKLKLMRLWVGDLGGVPDEAIAEIERLRAALQEFLNYKWLSVEKDNMEFQATVTCYTLEKARKALNEQLTK